MPDDAAPPAADLRSRVDGVDSWYHTMELTPGVVTPGFFDLRGIVDQLPWPDVHGRRCLDVGTFDGFYAFEMERRGAAEVVAIDIADAADLDWLPREAPGGYPRGREPLGQGFEVAQEAFGSSVRREVCSVYDLAAGDLGSFDVVVCGALLEHLRDPLRALEAMRSVCTGDFLSVELVSARATLLSPRTPLLVLAGSNRTWSLPNVAGHRRMLHDTGFDVEASTVLGIPLHPRHQKRASGLRPRLRRAAWWLMGTSGDPPFSAARATVAPELRRD